MYKSLQAAIQKHYGKHATSARRETRRCGCHDEGIGQTLYSREQLEALPVEVARASAGCGNPTALASLRPGETVLDLGSGGGIDVFLAARQVGETGFVYGLDMTPEMLALAQENARKLGVPNVEFLQGQIEQIPFPDASIDVILSNCVINLSADKDQVFSEAFRVLRPGGRLAVSDMMFVGDRALLPPQVRDSMDSWAACVAGALQLTDYQQKLIAAGFEDVSIQITSEYDPSVISGGSCCASASNDCCGTGATSTNSCCTPPTIEGIKLVSGFVQAYKPDPDRTSLPDARSTGMNR